MADWTEDELVQVIGEAQRRASVDPEFRQLAVTNTTAALAKITGRQLPANLSFQFHDNSGKTKHFVLPDPIAGIEELSEAELKSAAGGNTTVSGGWGR